MEFKLTDKQKEMYEKYKTLHKKCIDNYEWKEVKSPIYLTFTETFEGYNIHCGCKVCDNRLAGERLQNMFEKIREETNNILETRSVQLN